MAVVRRVTMAMVNKYYMDPQVAKNGAGSGADDLVSAIQKAFDLVVLASLMRSQVC